MTVELSEQDRTSIGNLSRSDVESTIRGLKRFLRKSAWIGKSNFYAKDAVSRLKRGIPANRERRRNLAQYIAASVTLHANDGWSYLGRAVGCILTGDTHRALHLAYYAELRAAMSLLASSGIGIFNRQHYIVPQVNSTSKLRAGHGTHAMAWVALEEWAKLSNSGDLFAKLVRPDGQTLERWFHAQGGATAVAAQAKAWFMQWGMDLGLAAKDQRARNESSYRPDGVPRIWEVDANDCLEFVSDLWRLLEPSPTSNFEQIDRHILRHAIESYFRGTSGHEPSPNNPRFAELVHRTVTRMSLPLSAEQRVKRFLRRQISPIDPSVFRYSAIKPGNPESDAFAVISRAVLLLRLATGSAYRQLESNGVDAEVLEFWWRKLGESRGIWQPGAAPSDLHDLWADVEESLNAIADAEDNHPPVLNSFSTIASNLAPELSVLASHERVGIWGLCPS